MGVRVCGCMYNMQVLSPLRDTINYCNNKLPRRQRVYWPIAVFKPFHQTPSVYWTLTTILYAILLY